MFRALLCFPLLLTGKESPIAYPNSYPDDTIEKIHGIEVADPYRWLENLNSKQTHQWIKEQNALTEKHLNRIPGREALNTHLTQLWNVERFGTPHFVGGRYFFSKTTDFKTNPFSTSPSP